MGLFDFIGDAFKAVNPLNLIGDVVGGVSNVASTAMTNEANKDLAEQQNQWNQEQWMREADFTREMWRANNEYNDPSLQMKRLTDAGLSPWAAASALGAGAGNATAAASPTGNAASAPVMQSANFSFIGDAMQRQFDNMLRQKQVNAEVRKTEAEADNAETNAAMNAAFFDNYWKQVQDENLIGMLLENKGRSKDLALKMQQLEQNSGNFMLDSFLKRQEMRLNEYRVTYQDLQNVGMTIQNELQKLNLQWLPAQIQAQLANVAASTYANIQAGNLSKQQTQHELYKQYQTILNTADVHNANEIANKLVILNLGNAAMDYLWTNKYNDINKVSTIGDKLWYQINDISKGVGHVLGNGISPLLKFLK